MFENVVVDAPHPVLTVTGRGLPQAWERSIQTLMTFGQLVPTQYDRPGDPKSVDAMMVMVVVAPLLEPRIHGFFPGGPDDLEEYCLEVCRGVKDHWVRDPNDPEDKRWGYTYHGRLVKDFGVDQVKMLIDKLVEDPAGRQAQATIWNPRADPGDTHSPCCQRLWVRLVEDPRDVGTFNATAHIYFRSRDALQAAFMNAFAFIRFFDEEILRPVQDRLIARGKATAVRFAQYVDVSDSYHVYGKDIAEGKVKAFANSLGKRYTYHQENEPWADIMRDARPAIRSKIEAQDKQRGTRR